MACVLPTVSWFFKTLVLTVRVEHHWPKHELFVSDPYLLSSLILITVLFFFLSALSHILIFMHIAHVNQRCSWVANWKIWARSRDCSSRSNHHHDVWVRLHKVTSIGTECRSNLVIFSLYFIDGAKFLNTQNVFQLFTLPDLNSLSWQIELIFMIVLDR